MRTMAGSTIRTATNCWATIDVAPRNEATPRIMVQIGG